MTVYKVDEQKLSELVKRMDSEREQQKTSELARRLASEHVQKVVSKYGSDHICCGVMAYREMHSESIEERKEFRGKRLDTGEWVYGSLIADDEDGYLIGTVSKSLGQLCAHPVEPGTIGQSVPNEDGTGVFFEGDVCQFGTSIVIFDWSRMESRWSWRFPNYDGGEDDPDTIELGPVIGNVHDNPEFLAGTAIPV